MKFLTILPLLVAVAVSAPVYPAVTDAFALPVPVPRIAYDFPNPIIAPPPNLFAVSTAPLAVGPAPVAVPAPYDFSDPLALAPAPLAVDSPVPAGPYDFSAPLVRRRRQVPMLPAPAVVDTRVNYASVPAVVGQTTQILKPSLGVNHPFTFGTLDSLDPFVVRNGRVLTPLRTFSNIIPQMTIQYPSRVNVQPFPVDVPVGTPFADPVPVPVVI